MVKTAFYQSKVIVLMREMVFDNFQKIWSGLGEHLDFFENFLWSPLCSPKGCLWSPVSIWPDFFFKLLFISRKWLFWWEKWFSTTFRMFGVGWGTFWIFLKISCGPPPPFLKLSENCWKAFLSSKQLVSPDKKHVLNFLVKCKGGGDHRHPWGDQRRDHRNFSFPQRSRVEFLVLPDSKVGVKCIRCFSWKWDDRISSFWYSSSRYSHFRIWIRNRKLFSV